MPRRPAEGKRVPPRRRIVFLPHRSRQRRSSSKAAQSGKTNSNGQARSNGSHAAPTVNLSLPQANGQASVGKLEIWGGVECTLNRVRNVYFDQLQRSGHATRIEDLEQFAELGIRTLRYPVLWERVAPAGLEQADWSWSDARLTRLRELGIEPIVGLLHHGSGPRSTSLVDPKFPEALARYARAVAERYPWVTYYTPINEPLTTARFSALYGHWYPHARSNRKFGMAMVHQCRAIARAMQEIRQVNPAAKLVQTEDLGKTYSTPKIKYQADWDNERRWLTFDALCGRLGPEHPLWGFFLWAGVPQEQLETLRASPCPPDILGINHYVTSERFLDERLKLYPAFMHGGNGRHRYVDVEAVRVAAEGIAGPRLMLEEVWQRYRLPVAVTEAHLGATREQQLRWLDEVWTAAKQLRTAGADIRAVTVWSLLGAFDWHTLVTRIEGIYESGVFDVRGPRPRRTALAQMVRDLAQQGEHRHPLLAQPGWWRSKHRLLFPPVSIGPIRGSQQITLASSTDRPPRPLLITGGTGTLGRAFARICEERGIAYQLCSRGDTDISDRESVERLLDALNPWAVVNAAGYVRIDDAEKECTACYRDNYHGPLVLAKVCQQRGLSLLTFSTDQVFDGTHGRPYVESDPVGPLGVYGKSKAEAERAVLKVMPTALVVRTSAFFGPWDEQDFLAALLRSLHLEIPFPAASDQTLSPTYLPDLVHTALDLLIDAEHGVWHLANDGAVSWAELACRAAEMAGFNTSLIQGCSSKRLGLLAQRPRFSVLGSERGMLLPTLDEAMSRYFSARATIEPVTDDDFSVLETNESLEK